MRILVVDDSAFMRRAIIKMIEPESDMEVVGFARNGREAVEKAKELKPDVITLDIEMPEMDGLTALRHIMAECPTAVLMCSSLTTEGSHAALRALKLGAVDIITKDTSQISLEVMNLKDDLLSKIRIAASSKKPRKPVVGTAAAISARREDPVPTIRAADIDLVVIGSSTGGPPVLETIIAALPADLAVPVVISQHMPALFTKSLAQRLDEHCAVSAYHGEHGMRLVPGAVYINPGGLHTRILKSIGGGFHLDIGPNPLDAIYKPSVNELMRSASESAGSRVLGIMLTGMGNDGCEGARTLVQNGGKLLAQTEESCVVYGMPKAVTEAGLASASLSPQRLAMALRPIRSIAKAG